MLLTGFTFADFVGFAFIVAILAFVFWFLRPPKQSSTKSSVGDRTPLIITPKYSGYLCRLCGKELELICNEDAVTKRELICPSCRQLHIESLQSRAYPPEILELLIENPEYEQELEPEKLMSLYQWLDYRKNEKDYQAGQITLDDYNVEYRRLIFEHKNKIISNYQSLKSARELASRPTYDPSRDSKF